MGLKCKISYNEEGIARVMGDNGKSSQLYAELLDFLGDQERALDAWAAAYSKEFGEQGENADIGELVAFLNVTATTDEVLSPSEIFQVKDFMARNGIKSLDELYSTLASIFKPDSIFDIDIPAAIQSGLFTEEEIRGLNPDAIDAIMVKISGHLVNDNFTVEPHDQTEMYKNSDSKTIFGTYEKVTREDIDNAILDAVDNFTDIEDFYNKIKDLPYPGFVQRFLEDDEFANTIINKFKGLKKVPTLHIVGDAITNNNLKFYTTVKNTVISGADTLGIEADIEYLDEIDPEIWRGNPDLIQQVLKEVEAAFAEINIDVVGISERLDRRGDIMDLLDAARDLAKAQTNENLNRFVGLHERLLPTEQRVVADRYPEKYAPLNIVKVFSNKSQNELFSKFGLIKVGDNLYHKVNQNASLDEIKEYIFEEVKAGRIQMDITSSFDNKPAVLEEISNNLMRRKTEAPINDKELYSAYQVAFNHDPLPNKSQEVLLLSDISTDETYLKTKFISDFYGYVLQEKAKGSDLYKKVLSKIDFNDSDISLAEPIDSLEDIEYREELYDYIRLKKDSNMKYLLPPSTKTLTEDVLYTNFPDRKSEYEGDVIIDGDYIITDPTADEFIKLNGFMYRKVMEKQNSNLFARIPQVQDNNYYTTNTDFTIDKFMAYATFEKYGELSPRSVDHTKFKNVISKSRINDNMRPDLQEMSTLKDKSYTFFEVNNSIVAYKDGVRVGAIRPGKVNGNIYSDIEVSVSESHRGRGIGTELYLRMFDKIGKEDITLYPSATRTKQAENIYSRLSDRLITQDDGAVKLKPVQNQNVAQAVVEPTKEITSADIPDGRKYLEFKHITGSFRQNFSSYISLLKKGIPTESETLDRIRAIIAPINERVVEMEDEARNSGFNFEDAVKYVRDGYTQALDLLDTVDVAKWDSDVIPASEIVEGVGKLRGQFERSVSIEATNEYIDKRLEIKGPSEYGFNKPSSPSFQESKQIGEDRIELKDFAGDLISELKKIGETGLNETEDISDITSKISSKKAKLGLEVVSGELLDPNNSITSNSDIHVIHYDGRILGALIVARNDLRLYAAGSVSNVLIHPGLRGKGIATELYRKINNDRISKGLSPLKSDSDQTPASQALWNRLVESGEAEIIGESTLPGKEGNPIFQMKSQQPSFQQGGLDRLRVQPAQAVEAIIDRLEMTGLSEISVITNKAQFTQGLREANKANKSMATADDVFGFTLDNRVYLNKDKFNFNTPIHEFGHLWFNWAKNNRFDLYTRGMELIEGSEYLKQIEEQAKNPKSVYHRMSPEKLKEEALVTAIGNKGEDFINKKAKEGFLGWLQDLWTAIAEAVGVSQVSADQLQDYTLDEFAQAVAIDLLKGDTFVTSDYSLNVLSDDMLAGKSGKTIKFTKLEADMGYSVTMINNITGEREEMDLDNDGKIVGTFNDSYRGKHLSQVIGQELSDRAFREAKEGNPIALRKPGGMVNVQTVKQVLKQQGVKKIEKEVIEEILELPNFKGKSKIPFDDLQTEINSRIMPLEVVESKTYSDYGMANTGVRGNVTAKTNLYNTDLDHGITGHFESDYSKVSPTEMEAVNIPGTSQFAVVRKGVQLTEDNIQGNVFHATSSKELAEQWIRDYQKSLPITNRGLFGHTRVWTQGKDVYVAEIQSDSFQKAKADDMLISAYDANPSRMTKEQKEVWKKIKDVESILAFVEAANDTGIDSRYDKSSPFNRYLGVKTLSTSINKLLADKKTIDLRIKSIEDNLAEGVGDAQSQEEAKSILESQKEKLAVLNDRLQNSIRLAKGEPIEFPKTMTPKDLPTNQRFQMFSTSGFNPEIISGTLGTYHLPLDVKIYSRQTKFRTLNLSSDGTILASNENSTWPELKSISDTGYENSTEKHLIDVLGRLYENRKETFGKVDLAPEEFLRIQSKLMKDGITVAEIKDILSKFQVIKPSDPEYKNLDKKWSKIIEDDFGRRMEGEIGRAIPFGERIRSKATEDEVRTVMQIELEGVDTILQGTVGSLSKLIEDLEKLPQDRVIKYGEQDVNYNAMNANYNTLDAFGVSDKGINSIANSPFTSTPQELFDIYKDAVEGVVDPKGYEEHFMANKNIGKLHSQLMDAASIRDKQFIAHRKNYTERLLREEIRRNAEEGMKTLSIPTPRTLALIEGYIDASEGGIAPYEVISSGRMTEDGDLSSGDIIEYLDEAYIVISSNGYDIEIARQDDGWVVDGNQWRIDQVDSMTSDDMYNFDKEVGSKTLFTQEEWQEVIDNADMYVLEESYIENFSKDEIEDEDGTIRYEIDRDLVEEAVQEYHDNFYMDVEGNLNDIYSEVYKMDDGQFFVTEKIIYPETLKQPDQYQAVDVDAFDIDDMSSTEQTILRKYEELVEKFKEERPDAEITEDNNGNQWITTRLTFEDGLKPVVAFQEVQQETKTPDQNIENISSIFDSQLELLDLYSPKEEVSIKRDIDSCGG